MRKTAIQNKTSEKSGHNSIFKNRFEVQHAQRERMRAREEGILSLFLEGGGGWGAWKGKNKGNQSVRTQVLYPRLKCDPKSAQNNQSVRTQTNSA